MALLLCSFVLASCAAGSTATKPTPTLTSPTAVPARPGTPLALTKQWTVGPVADIAVTPDAVYVLHTTAASQGAQAFARDTRLARIDRRSGALSTAGPFPGAFHIAVAAGVVWMGINLAARSNPPGSNPPDGSYALVGVEAQNLQVLQRVTLPADGQSSFAPNLAGRADVLWVAYGTHVYRLAGSSGRTLGSQTLGGVQSSISIDSAGKRVYVGIIEVPVSANSTIIEFDPVILRVVVADTTGGGDLGGPQLAAGANDLWVAYATGMLGQVERRQASNLAKLPVASALHTNGVRVYEIAGVVWVADQMAGQLECLDPESGAVRVAWITNQGAMVAGDASGLYFADVSGVGSFQLDSRCH